MTESETKTIPKGYKQTEVGVIPEEWELVSYGQAFNFLKTASYSRDQIKEEGPVGYIHYGDIHTRFEHFLDLDQDELPKINKEQARPYSVVREGDLIVVDASEDYSGIAKSVEVKNVKDKKVISGLHTFLLRSNEGYFENEFKGYIHSSSLVKAELDRYATGMKVFGVSRTNLRHVLIPKPKKNEQIAIAETLTNVDKLIVGLEKLIAKKKAVKQGVMQELLTGKHRLPGFSREWEKKRLGDVVSLQGGYSFQSNNFQKTGVPIIRISNIYDKMISLEVLVYYPSIKIPKQFVIKKGDVLIAMSGATTGKVGVYNYSFSSYQNQRVGKFIVCDLSKNDNDYIAQLVQSDLFLIGLKKEIAQGAQPNVSGKQIESIELDIPLDIDEQKAIAELLSNMDSDINSLELKLKKYKQIKIGMMQQLLTGKIRIYDKQKS